MIARANRSTAELAPVLAGAGIVTALAAVRAALPGSPGSHLTEVGACVAIGALILAAAGAASDAERWARHAHRRRLPALAARQLLQVAGRAGLFVLLCLPAVAVAWEGGGDAAQLGSLAIAAATAIVCGTVLGALPALAGIPAPASTLLAMVAGALLLWPASLRWVDLSVRFPAPETPASALLAIVVSAALIGSAALALRRRRA